MAWRLTKVEPNSLVMPHRCWLRTWGWQNGQGFYLNDHNCNYCYQTYLCSTNHYQWTGDECQVGDEGLPAECA